MDNYEFCTKWVTDRKLNDNVRVLDYGCGDGRIVKMLREHNVNAFGCDTFYEGGDYSKLIESELFDNGIIKKINEDTIPFKPNSFDFVINHQVMEHVEDLDSVLSEIQRVLKPDGSVLSLFPDKGVWREAHCGIPFLHWFPKNSRLRIYYTAGLRFIGFGHHKGDKSIMGWSRDFCEWLDKWTCYRTRKEVDTSYNKYFRETQHIEDDFLQKRLGSKKSLVSWLPLSIQQLIVKKLAGIVFVSKKIVIKQTNEQLHPSIK